MTHFNYDQFQQDLDEIKLSTLEKVGTHDANHIRRVIRQQRFCSWGGRILLMMGLKSLTSIAN